MTNGVYNVKIGASNPTGLAAAITGNPELYLGINVNAEGELLPRIHLSSTAYAFRAQSAESASAIGDMTTTQASTLVGGPASDATALHTHAAQGAEGRSIYLSPNAVTGNQALTQCAAGYHARAP